MLKLIMLLGEYTHTLDSKNRLIMPTKFKSELGKKIVITRGLDDSLFVYSVKEWKVITERLAGLSMTDANSRGFSRFFLAGAVEVSIDKSGRVLIPEHLRNFARIGKEVVVTGVQTRVEIWDSAQWNRYKKKIEKDADIMAEKLGEIGVI